jgi:hypothetical protein
MKHYALNTDCPLLIAYCKPEASWLLGRADFTAVWITHCLATELTQVIDAAKHFFCASHTEHLQYTRPRLRINEKYVQATDLLQCDITQKDLRYQLDHSQSAFTI